MDSDPLLWPILLQIVLIALNAVFACAEIAVISVNDAKLEKLAETDSRARILQKLTKVPAKFLATIQVAITLSGFLGSAFAADNFAPYLVNALKSVGITIHQSVAVVLITVILSYVTLIFGELVPKRLAMKSAEKLALGMAKMLYGVSVIFAPLVWLLTVSTNGVLRLLGVDPNAEEEQVTEEEIRMMVDAGSEKGTIDTDEKEMIQNVFEFDDISADEICTHRPDVAFLWADDSLEEWEKTIHESRHSLFPVCGEDADDILGILDAKDFFRLRGSSKDEILAQAVKRPYFVPEYIKADVLFANMKKSGNYFAVVLDEYGGMDGIITLRDLIEQLVGTLTEEDEEDRTEEIEKVSEDLWRIQGSTPMDDVSEALGVELPEEDYDTFGGYIFGKLAVIPEDGSQFELEVDGLHIKVLQVKEHRIEGTLVRVLPKQEEAESDREKTGREKA
ncbi:MAG TPA: HlyC/CorC family transporter [Candidatus Scatomonas pullistercoris]|uniref:HlyC/CorC family transporter n=1 Tax=Candidatus Scatomonas pullistercoris TaxID=2840920 RepID=A0A9D1P3H2_9FIRM|nr:HlyC/CorC family transporter [Candidatus Scatomonas pullistercoris]